MKYFPTALELWVVNMFKRIGIYTPHDLEEKAIADFLRIFLYYKSLPTTSYENGHFRSITIDQRLPLDVQREAFYHELCHILRHSGWQTGLMPITFKEFQEWDAINFTRYAAIPFHMLRHFDLMDPDIIPLLADAFKVTPELCQERLNKIMGNVVHAYTLQKEKII